MVYDVALKGPEGQPSVQNKLWKILLRHCSIRIAIIISCYLKATILSVRTCSYSYIATYARAVMQFMITVCNNH